MTTSESKGRFFLQNESIRIANWNALVRSRCGLIATQKHWTRRDQLTVGDGPRYVGLEQSVLKVDSVHCSVFDRRRNRQHRRRLTSR